MRLTNLKEMGLLVTAQSAPRPSSQRSLGVMRVRKVFVPPLLPENSGAFDRSHHGGRVGKKIKNPSCYGRTLRNSWPPVE